MRPNVTGGALRSWGISPSAATSRGRMSAAEREPTLRPVPGLEPPGSPRPPGGSLADPLGPLSRPLVRDRDVWAASPLALLTTDGRVHALFALLAGQLEAMREADVRGERPPVLRLRSSDVEYARARWDDSILRGERLLYNLATLLAWRFLGTRDFQTVVRIVAGPDEGYEPESRIVIEERLDPSTFERVSDHTLASRIAQRYQYRPHHDEPFGRLYPRASFLEFRASDPADEPNVAVATRVLTRLKVDEQIWNKVCDAFFGIDDLVQRDKILNTMSRFIKDIFGIKVLTPTPEASFEVDRALATMRFRPDELAALGVEAAAAAEELRVIERKDYLTPPPSERKQTGWAAIKNVHRWAGQIFEVQIQTESNYVGEQSRLSSASHFTFQMRRRVLRHRLEEVVPYYREFRRVLKALFKPDLLDRKAAMPAWLEVDP